MRYKVAMRARYGPGAAGPWSAHSVLRVRGAVETPAAAKDTADGDKTGGGTKGGLARQTSTDATLSALSVNGVGVSGFDAATLGYQAGVASTSDVATVAATPTHSGAAAVITPGDADTAAAGHQVSLSAGPNAVSITVTAQNGSTTKTYTVSVNRGVASDWGWKASEDFDGLAAAGNADPSGIWSDGTTMWVAQAEFRGTSKLYAYKVSDKTRDSSKDFDTIHAAGNTLPLGIWSDKTTMWVANWGRGDADKKIFAYKMSDTTRDSSKDFDTLHAAENDSPRGIWSDGITMWVADTSDDKLYAYKMSDKTRDSSKDFTLDARNGSPSGIWSDETTMWVADTGAFSKLYAYKMSDKTRDSSRDSAWVPFQAGRYDDPGGIWSDGTTMWVTDEDYDKVFSYNLPVYAVSAVASGTSLVITFSQDLAEAAGLANTAFTVEKISSGGVETPVSLSGSPVVSGKTVTLTLSAALAATDRRVEVSYAKPASGTGNKLAAEGGNEVASFDDLVGGQPPNTEASLSALSVSPTDIVGFSADRLSYHVGVGAAVATATVTATPADSYASVSFSPDDADSVADGYQRSLSAGRNGMSVKVTAEDDSTTKIYRLSVNRGVTTEYGWKASEDFDGLWVAGNDSPRAIWSNGTTMWVVDSDDGKLYAYNASDGTRDPDKDFDGLAAAGNNSPRGVWSDKTTMWVSDPSDRKLYAYKMSDKTHDSSKDFDTLDAGNWRPAGIWSDETTMWVADSGEKKIFAYKMSDKARDPDKDFDTLDGAGNDDPQAIWSDETTMWVSDWTDQKIYAYKMSDKAYDMSRDFDAVGPTEGIWSDGTTMWMSGGGKIYSYNHPVYAASASVSVSSLAITFTQDLAEASGLANSDFTVKKTADGTEAEVALSGSPVISGNTVTLTLSTLAVVGDTDFKVSYAKPTSGTDNKLVGAGGNEVTGFADLGVAVAEYASTDASLSALAVDGVGVAGFSAGRLGYQWGVAAASATATVAATPAHSGAAAVITPRDADSNADGHQVRLSAGRNAVSVVVTAQDGSTTETYTVSVNRGVTADWGWRASGDFDGLIAAGNDVPGGLWSNGTTMWVLDFADRRLYAYNMSDKARDPDKDLDFATIFEDHYGRLYDPASEQPHGLWSDGTTMWVSDISKQAMFAYNLSERTYDPDKDFSATTLQGPGGQGIVEGMWSDGTTMWVSDTARDQLTAYKMSDWTRDPDRDFATLHAAGNNHPEGIWSDETTMWVTDTTDDKLYAYKMSDQTRDPGKDFDNLAANNGRPHGLWSDGTTMWVLDTWRVFAYKMSDQTRDPDKDFDTLHLAGNNLPFGIWSDETTMWVSDWEDRKVYAYNMSDQTRDPDKDLDTLANSHFRPGDVWSDGDTMWVSNRGAGDQIFAYDLTDEDKTSDFDEWFRHERVDDSGNGSPWGMWSDGTTMWVSDSADDKLFAYKMSDRTRDFDKDFDTLDAAGNNEPFEIWSDGTTMWVSDWEDDKLFAYKMSDTTRDPARDFDTADAPKDSPAGIWSDGTTMWVSNSRTDDKVYSYNLPVYPASATVSATTLVITFSQDLAPAASLANSRFTVKKTAGGSQTTVSLTGSPVISGDTVTLTLSTAVAAGDTDVKVSYAKPTSGTDNKLAGIGGNQVSSFANLAVNTAPAFASTTATRSLAENTPGRADVGAPVSATDPQGDTLAYTLSGDDAESFDIVSATGQIRTVKDVKGVYYDYEDTASWPYTVTVTATDTAGLTASTTVTISLTDVDEPPDVPNAPTVSAIAGATPGMRVSWTAPVNPRKPPIISYDVQYRPDGATSWTDGPQDQTLTTVTITGLAASTIYEARVRATNDEGDSDWSDWGRTEPDLDARCGTTEAEQRTRCAVTHLSIFYGYGWVDRTQLSWRHPRTRPGITRPDSYTVQMRTRGKTSDDWGAWIDQLTVTSHYLPPRQFADFTPPDCGDVELRVRPNYTNDGVATRGVPAATTFWRRHYFWQAPRPDCTS